MADQQLKEPMLSEDEIEPLAMRLFLPKYYGVGEEDVKRIITSHYAQTEYIEALESRGKELMEENDLRKKYEGFLQCCIRSGETKILQFDEWKEKYLETVAIYK